MKKHQPGHLVTTILGIAIRFRVLPLALIITTLVVGGSTSRLLPEALPQPGYQHFLVGTIPVTALSDGTVPVSAAWLFGPRRERVVGELLRDEFLTDPVEVSINAYLITLRDKCILVDAGAGDLFGPEHGGQLLSSLRAAGYRPEQITDVLITHIHLDHSGGLTTQGRLLFPNATVHVNQQELDFWQEHQRPAPNEARGIKDNRAAYLALKSYLDAGKVQPFAGDVRLFPEIKAVEYPGHTPGHTVFVLESSAEKLVFWGDLIHVAAVQLHAPALANEFDGDQSCAAGQRRRAYQLAAEEGHLVAADHISFPGLGCVRKDARAYRWLPLPFSRLGRTR